MHKQKEHILTHFNKASESYDHVAFIQKDCARKLTRTVLHYCPTFTPSTILDVGTGTGYVSEFLLQAFPSSRYTLNDISSEMLEIAKRKLSFPVPPLFIHGDFEQTDFSSHDLIISNLALQWGNDLNGTIAKLFGKSKILAFSCLLFRTFHEWSDLFEKLNFPIPTYGYPMQYDLESYLLSLKPKRSYFDSKKFTLDFKNPLDFMRYLKDLGANKGQVSLPYSALKKLISENNRNFSVTYNVFFGCMIR
jgi:malonyl-CoA O-methyltransferase